MFREITIILTLVITLAQAQVDGCIGGTQTIGNQAAIDPVKENVNTIKEEMKKDMKLHEIKSCVNPQTARLQNIQFVLKSPETGATLELLQVGPLTEEIT